MNALLKQLLIVCPLVFLAGFVDSVAGGGGLISLPAYLMAGLPVHLAAGTNKLVAGTGTLAASITYFKSGKVRLRPALTAGIFAMLGSALGTELAALVSERCLHTLLLVALPCVALFLTLRKDFGKAPPASVERSVKRELLISAAIGLLLGCYDGIIGPGTGTFMLMCFTAFLSMDMLSGSGCAKLANLASNIAAATVWILNGKILWALVLPAALSSILGNRLGAKFALRGGSSRVRSMVFVVLALLFCKMAYELIRSRLG